MCVAIRRSNTYGHQFTSVFTYPDLFWVIVGAVFVVCIERKVVLDEIDRRARKRMVRVG